MALLTGTELEADPQLKPMLWIPSEQPEGAFLPGLKVTLLAPPHCEFWMMLPSREQE